MEITETRTYHFTAAELYAINTCCRIANNIFIKEKDNDNEYYSFETFFNTKYEEYIKNGRCDSTFAVIENDIEG